MAISWLNGKKKEDEGEGKGTNEEIELKPAEVKAQLDKIGSLESGFNSFKTESKATMDRMAAYLDKQDKDEATRLENERRAKATKTQEELDDEFLTDPKEATKKLMRPLVETSVNHEARDMMRDMLDNNTEKYGLMTDPNFKSQVEKLVFGLPLSQRANLQSIENCFYVAQGQNADAIKEGKIKARFAASSSVGGGEGEKGKGTETFTLTDEQKKAAKVFGMTDEQYGKARKEYVSGV